MPKFKLLIAALGIWSTLTIFPIIQPVQAQQWVPVRGGIKFGISGIALLEQKLDVLTFLIVHDNKGGKEEGRLAIITLESQNPPQYLPLNWPKNEDLPIDLESLTTLPGAGEQTFLASTSAGKVYHLQVDISSQEVAILQVFDLPGMAQGSNLEGFALQEIDGKLLAVWAHRGAAQEPAVIYWGVLNLDTYQITLQGSDSLRVPWPVGQVRHISDLKVDSAGILYITAATDNGNDGPFQSAVYTAGVFTVTSNQLQFRENPAFVPLYRLDYHKVEAIELIPGAAGGVVLGTDDENLGSSILGEFSFMLGN